MLLDSTMLKHALKKLRQLLFQVIREQIIVNKRHTNTHARVHTHTNIYIYIVAFQEIAIILKILR